MLVFCRCAQAGSARRVLCCAVLCVASGGPGRLVFWHLREQMRGAWPAVTKMWRWQMLRSSCFVVSLVLQTRNWPAQRARRAYRHLISAEWA